MWGKLLLALASTVILVLESLATQNLELAKSFLFSGPSGHKPLASSHFCFCMARPRVADGGTASRWLAANILNKQSRTDNKGWPSSLGVGRGVHNPSP
jgi:hypothetical protein